MSEATKAATKVSDGKISVLETEVQAIVKTATTLVSILRFLRWFGLICLGIGGWLVTLQINMSKFEERSVLFDKGIQSNDMRIRIVETQNAVVEEKIDNVHSTLMRIEKKVDP